MIPHATSKSYQRQFDGPCSIYSYLRVKVVEDLIVQSPEDLDGGRGAERGTLDGVRLTSDQHVVGKGDLGGQGAY